MYTVHRIGFDRFTQQLSFQRLFAPVQKTEYLLSELSTPKKTYHINIKLWI